MRRLPATLAIAAAALVAPSAGAQMPGLPVLQNAFTNPGITVAVNGGFANDANTFGGAVAWVPGSGRFGLSGGLGSLVPDSGATTPAYGLRAAAAVPWLSRLGDLGVSVFVGAGGASRSRVSTMYVPAGVAVGWRHGLGATRGFSLYAAPFYGWTRVRSEGVTQSAGVVRASFGADVTVMPRLGVTAGVETGATAKDGDPGPTGTVFGVGVSYAFR